MTSSPLHFYTNTQILKGFLTYWLLILGFLSWTHCWWHKPKRHYGLSIVLLPTMSRVWTADRVQNRRSLIVSREPFTCVGSLVHWHRQLDDVIHPLCVLGFLWLLTHNPLLHQEPEGFRWVGPRAAIPLWVGKKRAAWKTSWGEKRRAEWDGYVTSTMFMKCNKNSWASCCRLVENSGWPRPTSALNILGAMPIWSPCKQACPVRLVKGES